MKKTLILAIIIIATCTVSLAQPRAIGGRLGWGVSPSYQHGFGEKNMLQVDLDFFGFYWGIQATVTYNWIFPFKSWSGPGSWNWYTGVGAGGGISWNSTDTGLLGVAGMIGVEYIFKFPLQLALEYRPIVGPWFRPRLNDVGFHYFGLSGGGLAIRYKF